VQVTVLPPWAAMLDTFSLQAYVGAPVVAHHSQKKGPEATLP